MNLKIISCLLLIPTFVYADTVYFKNRNPISGKIIKETEENVIIKMHGDSVNYVFPTATISKIEKGQKNGTSKKTVEQETGVGGINDNAALKNPEYEIIDEKITDEPVKTQVHLAVLVSGKVTKEWVTKLLYDLYDSAMERADFKYHKQPTNVYIYAVISKEHYEAGMGQWIAMLAKSYSDTKPNISVNELQIAKIGAQPIEKFGLSQAKRQEIWTELVRAEDMAYAEAENAYPVPEAWKPSYSLELARQQMEKQATLQEEFYGKYKAEIMAKYGLTQEQEADISYEAYEKDWAFPK
ncbi:MAG: hypothetical protein KJ661_05835 [Candidatus Omnitrophica bacterium]|nr:hypothetical protein [Candidatus Omnitrophota bacterium]